MFLKWGFKLSAKNNCRGFHLLFPFSRWPNSKAMMYEGKRGNIDRYIFSYIFIKMDLVLVATRNLLMLEEDHQ